MDLAENAQMEDYSLRYAPAAFRRWSPWMVFLSCMVGLSAMVGYALDATFVKAFGFGNTLLGFVIAGLVTLPLMLVIAFAIARKHVDIDLLTRGSGFGYLGSTLTSLVYATYTLIFLGYEGAIMAQAVTALTHLDIHISYVLVAVVMIPLTLYGMTFSAKFQAWTWPLWLVADARPCGRQEGQAAVAARGDPRRAGADAVRGDHLLRVHAARRVREHEAQREAGHGAGGPVHRRLPAGDGQSHGRADSLGPAGDPGPDQDQHHEHLLRIAVVVEFFLPPAAPAPGPRCGCFSRSGSRSC
jgi:hypothetical protein